MIEKELMDKIDELEIKGKVFGDDIVALSNRQIKLEQAVAELQGIQHNHYGHHTVFDHPIQPPARASVWWPDNPPTEQDKCKSCRDYNKETGNCDATSTCGNISDCQPKEPAKPKFYCLCGEILTIHYPSWGGAYAACHKLQEKGVHIKTGTYSTEAALWAELDKLKEKK